MQQQDDELLKLKSPTGGFEQPTEPVMANLDCIISELPNGFATFDRQWRYTYANNRLLEIFKLSRAEVLGKKAWEVFPHQVGIKVFELLNRAMTERIETQFEFYYELAECWVEHRVYPTAEGLAILMADISERKRAELARVAAEQERDRFFNLSIDLLAIANFDGYFLRLNPAWEQTLGFTAAELMAQPYLDLVHPDDLATTLAADQELSTCQSAIRFENRYRCKDGSYRWLSWSSMPYDEQNLVYAVAHDITERKRDEERLRQSEELTRRILESNRDCIKVVDLAGRLIYMNDYGHSLMEIDDFSTVARGQWLEFWQDRDRESARTAFSIASAGGVHQFDGYCPTSKGTPKWWEVIVTPILAADGQVSQILSVSRDITERKQSQAALEERNQELDSFVYIVSHDLKAPLRAISNLSVWIEEDLDIELPAETQQQMAQLRGRVQRMESMINGLLDYARVGSTDTQFQLVSVAELLADILDSLAPPSTFKIVIAPDLPTFHTKRLLLSQVFANLIGNAFKHHDKSNGFMRISSQERGDFYEFTIIDDGPGIPQEQHDRVFIIFQSTNPQKNPDSTGIGLSIVKKIVETVGGQIRLESELGKGTTFYFTWPK